MKFTPSIGLFLLFMTGCSHLQTPTWPGPGSNEATREAQLSVGRVYEDQGDLEKARTIYEQLVKNDSRNASALHRLGVVAAKQSNFEESRELLATAQKHAPNNADLLTDLGYTYYLEGNFDQAAESLKKAISLQSDNDRARNNLGLVLGRQGRYNESFAMFRDVVGDAKAHANVAFIQAQNGDATSAEKHFSRALDLDHELRSASDGLLQLAQTQSIRPPDADQQASQIQQAAAFETEAGELGSHQHFDVSGTRRRVNRMHDTGDSNQDQGVQQANFEVEANPFATDASATEPSASDASPAAGAQTTRTNWATTTRPMRHDSLLAQ